jgi:hypothetical protein
MPVFCEFPHLEEVAKNDAPPHEYVTTKVLDAKLEALRNELRSMGFTSNGVDDVSSSRRISSTNSSVELEVGDDGITEQGKISERGALTNIVQSVIFSGTAAPRCDGLHCWILSSVTAPDTTSLHRLLGLLLSAGVVLLQSMALVLVILECDQTRCLEHATCPHGTFCAGIGAGAGGGAGAAGSCYDCGLIENHFQYAEYLAGEVEIIGGAAFCNQTDMFRDRCDCA